MSCRCQDIRLCREDLSSLSQIIESLRLLADQETLIGRKLLFLTAPEHLGFSPVNRDELTHSGTQLNAPVVQARLGMLEDCLRERDRLQNLLPELEDEDRSWHDAEDKW